jgi:hypothetical protein
LFLINKEMPTSYPSNPTLRVNNCLASSENMLCCRNRYAA